MAIKPLFRVDLIESLMYPKQKESVRDVTEALLDPPKVEDCDDIIFQSMGSAVHDPAFIVGYQPDEGA